MPATLDLKNSRLATANALIKLIAARGRRFFDHSVHGKSVSRFELAANGRLWFVDGYSDHRVYVMYRRGAWRGFTEGGTLRALIENLADYIQSAKPILAHFGPWPDHYCDGDLWGYGKEEMAALRAEIDALLGEVGNKAHIRAVA